MCRLRTLGQSFWLRIQQLALRIDEFGIQVHSNIPAYRVKDDMYTFENSRILEPLKNTEIQEGFHVQNSLFAIIKVDDQYIIVHGCDFYHCRVHHVPSKSSPA